MDVSFNQKDNEETVIVMENDDARGEDGDPVKPKRPFTLLPRLSRATFVSLLWLVVAVELAAWYAPLYILPPLALDLTFQDELLILLGSHGVAVFLLFYFVGMRLRDTGRSASWSVLLFVPAFNVFLLVVLIFSPGTKNWNPFGPPAEDPGGLSQLLGIYIPILLLVAAGVTGYFHQGLVEDYLSRFFIPMIQWVQAYLPVF